jgi:preprotein translocase subunit SecG
MGILINICLTIYVIVALLMVFVILMQRPKSEGLGAAFGGGVTENIFGAQTTNVLTKITAWLAGIFFLLTFALSIMYAHRSAATSTLRRELMKGEPAAAATSSPAPGASVSPAAPGAPQPNVSQDASPGLPQSAPASPPPESAAIGVVPAGAPVAPPAPPATSAAPSP